MLSRKVRKYYRHTLLMCTHFNIHLYIITASLSFSFSIALVGLYEEPDKPTDAME